MTPCYQPQNSGEQDLKKASNKKCVENMYREAVLDSPGSIFLSFQGNSRSWNQMQTVGRRRTQS